MLNKQMKLSKKMLEEIVANLDQQLGPIKFGACNFDNNDVVVIYHNSAYFDIAEIDERITFKKSVDEVVMHYLLGKKVANPTTIMLYDQDIKGNI
jgi:hypothetical protein